jgi:hypothetical protein
MLSFLLNRLSIVLALAFLMPTTAFAGFVEYAVILLLADGSASTYEVCLYNPADTEESTFLEFDPSQPGGPSDRQEVVVAPGQTECREFVGLPNGALLKIDTVPGESKGVGGGVSDIPIFGSSGNDVISYAGERPAFLRKLAVQLFLKNAGVRTGSIGLSDVIVVKEFDSASPKL